MGALLSDIVGSLTVLLVIPAALALSIPMTPTTRCDIIERNFYYAPDGHLIMEQYIFWDWLDGELVVVDWRLARSCTRVSSWKSMFEITAYTRNSVGAYVHPLRVLAYEYRETHTLLDPEQANTKILRKKDRRKLFKGLPRSHRSP